MLSGEGEIVVHSINPYRGTQGGSKNRKKEKKDGRYDT